jgi:hypothetical protein
MARGIKTGGRVAGTPNKVTQEVKAIAEPYGPQAIARLAHLMEHAESEAAQVAAARELLDRAYGKSPQSVSNPDGSAISFPASLVFQIMKQQGADCQQ